MNEPCYCGNEPTQLSCIEHEKGKTGKTARDRDRERCALTPLVPLVDACFDRMELLKARGWYSFEPYWC